MRQRPPSRARSVLAIGILAVFTPWITWRAKVLELGNGGNNTSSLLIGKPAPEFAVPSLEGRTISLKDYRDKTIVISFWASWCGPCRMELPVLADFYRRTHKPESDFEVLAISIDTAKDDAESAAKSLKVPFPVLLDPNSRVAESYGVFGIPVLFVIDKSGKVTYSQMGFQPGVDMLLAGQLGIRNYTAAPFGGPK